MLKLDLPLANDNVLCGEDCVIGIMPLIYIKNDASTMNRQSQDAPNVLQGDGGLTGGKVERQGLVVPSLGKS